MKISEVWSGLSPEMNHKLLEAAYLHDKSLYRRLNGEMAKGLRKRPKQLLELPRSERHALFQPVLSLPIFAMLAQNVAIVWLSFYATAMMADFLDQLSVQHDGKGVCGSFPADVDQRTLEKAMRFLLDRHPREEVLFYLNIFPQVSGTRWPGFAPALQAVSAG